MYDTIDGWDSEREAADMLQAEFEAQGRALDKRHRKMRALRAAGDLMGAAQACNHGAGYPLKSIAAQNSKDPRTGEPGVRCTTCGSVVSGFPWDGVVRVLVPCELAGER